MSNPASFNAQAAAASSITPASGSAASQQLFQQQQVYNAPQQTQTLPSQPRPPVAPTPYVPVAGPSNPVARPPAPPIQSQQQARPPPQQSRPPGQAQVLNLGSQQRPPTLGYGGQQGTNYAYGGGNNTAAPQMSTEERAKLQAFQTRLSIASTYVVKKPATLGGKPPKRQEFVGEQDLLLRSAEIVKQHSMKIDADATAYLALAAERRIRDILDDLLAAKAHRVSTAIHRTPPISEDGKPMWSHKQTSDHAALLAALARQNEEAEKQNRKRRMDRLDLELKEKARRDAGLAAAAASEPSTPQVAPETPGPSKKMPKKDIKASLLETSVKQSNQTALRSIGTTPKYAWMTGGASPAFAGRKKQKLEAQETPVKASGSGWARSGSKLAKQASPEPVVVIDKPVSQNVRVDTAVGVVDAPEDKAIMVKDVRIVAAARGMGKIGERMMASIAKVSADKGATTNTATASSVGGTAPATTASTA